MDDKTQDSQQESSQSALDAYRAAQREEEEWLERMRKAAKAQQDKAGAADKSG